MSEENAKMIEVKANEAITATDKMKEQVKELVVSSPETEKTAAEMLGQIALKISQITEWFDPQVKSAHATHKELCKKRNEATNPYSEMGDLLNEKISEYRHEVRKRQEEAEAKAKAEAEAKAKKEQEKLQAKAEKAEAKGLTDTAEELKAQAEQVAAAPRPVAAKPQAIETSAGKVNDKTTTRFSIQNQSEFLKALFDGKIPFNVLEVKDSAMRQFAKLHGIESGVHYGIKFWQETKVSFRRSR